MAQKEKKMKSFANSFNKTSFGIDTADFNYIKLSDIFNDPKNGGEEVVHPINGLYVHKSPLGDSAVIIDAESKKLVNLPSHMGETVREILQDREAIEAIKQGKVGYSIYKYDSHGKTCYSIMFVDK